MTDDGPVMLIVMGSLSAMVAVAAEDPLSRKTWDDSVDVIVPRVTVKVSDPSDKLSSVTGIVMVCVEPAAELAEKVTVPDVPV